LYYYYTLLVVKALLYSNTIDLDSIISYTLLRSPLTSFKKEYRKINNFYIYFNNLEYIVVNYSLSKKKKYLKK